MPCPACGGTERKPIAPSYWECTTLLTHRGYRPAPGPSSGPVPLQPHIATGRCGQRYPERSPANDNQTFSTGTCNCGVFAIARCTSCGHLLCGDHIQRRGGKVYCQEDARSHDLAGDEAQLSRFFDRVSSLGAMGENPIETALRLIKFGQRAPAVAAYPYFGGGIAGTPTAVDRLSRRVAAFQAALPEHPWFDVQPLSGHVFVTDPDALTQWVYDSGRFPLVRMPIDRLATFLRRHRRIVGHLTVAELAPPGQPAENPQPPRGRYLLPNGAIYGGGTVPDDWRTQDQYKFGSDWAAVATALGIHLPVDS